MSTMAPKTYNDIDWVLLRSNAMSSKGWKSKSSKDWDQKAPAFSKRNTSSAYVDLFLSHLPLEESHTILDIGCGPGTLAIPISEKVRAVTAIDFSKGMLNTLDSIARDQNITNISSVQCSWEDNWAEKSLVPHDIAIASRSMGVADLSAALNKINDYAKKYVFISDRVGSTPFDEAAFKALGRPFKSGPDYIYTLNSLYSMGIHPNVTMLQLEKNISYSSMEDAMNSYSWMFKDITPDETVLLEKFIISRSTKNSAHSITLTRDNPAKWALIWWKK